MDIGTDYLFNMCLKGRQATPDNSRSAREGGDYSRMNNWTTRRLYAI